MKTVEEAREEALSFISQEGLDREFVENVSIKIEDARKLINLCRRKKPQKILEIGTFVGVSTSILGLCLPQSDIVCIDPDLPIEVEDSLCIKNFEIESPKTAYEIVVKLLKHFDIFSRITLKKGYFSCYFPDQTDLDKVVNYGIKPKDNEIIGLEVCEEYGPFDLAFLDGDHRTEAVKQDLKLLLRYIKPSGMIVLHDVGLDYWGQQVRQGVEEFLKEHPQKQLNIDGEIGLISI